MADADGHEIAATLVRLWRRAAKEVGPATEAFEELSRAAGPANCSQWQAEAEAADREREHKVEAMDIYDIHSKPCE